MQHNQVFVIQVSSGTNKPPLALPAPPDSLLPSEVKYSASLVRGLGCTHLVLGAVLFLLGILGSWVEPETCWSGAGVWAGLAAECCGVSGLVAHRLWYKNFSIKTFLLSSVASVIISILAVILSIYAMVNRHKYFLTLVEQNDQYSWFQPYDLKNEHRLTLSVSANLVVGFILEVVVGLWSVKVGWRGVRSPDFTASHRGADLEQQPSMDSLHRPGQQVPLAALYQLLQTHPELLSNNKRVMGGVGAPWEEHPTHRSMDYQERVTRFLSHAIGDQNHSFPRSLSTLPSEHQDSSSPAGSSSGGRGSPADTLPMLPDHTRTHRQGIDLVSANDNTHSDRKQKLSNSELLQLKRSDHKAKAPAPKLGDKNKLSENSNKSDANIKDKTKSDKFEKNISAGKINKENNISDSNAKDGKDSKGKPSTESQLTESKQTEKNLNKDEQVLEKVANNTHSPEKKIIQKNVKEEIHANNTEAKNLNTKNTDSRNSEIKSDNTAQTKKSDKETKKEVRNQETVTETREQLKNNNAENKDNLTTPTIDQLGLPTDIQPPCEFQDT